MGYKDILILEWLIDLSIGIDKLLYLNKVKTLGRKSKRLRIAKTLKRRAFQYEYIIGNYLWNYQKLNVQFKVKKKYLVIRYFK